MSVRKVSACMGVCVSVCMWGGGREKEKERETGTEREEEEEEEKKRERKKLVGEKVKGVVPKRKNECEREGEKD